MKKRLTKEKALSLHRDMWAKMQKEHGDNADIVERLSFKEDYCHEYLKSIGAEQYESIRCDCFLCEYKTQIKMKDCHTNCLIDWSSLAERNDLYYGSCMGCYNGRSLYLTAPISEILVLPEREGNTQ